MEPGGLGGPGGPGGDVIATAVMGLVKSRGREGTCALGGASGIVAVRDAGTVVRMGGVRIRVGRSGEEGSVPEGSVGSKGLSNFVRHVLVVGVSRDMGAGIGSLRTS